MLNSRSYKRIDKKMKYAGMIVNPMIFILMRLASSLILLVFLLFFSSYGYIVGPIVTIIYYYFIEYVILDIQIGKRKQQLEEDSLEYFPILLLCLNGSNNVKKAISLTNEQVNNSLSKEFERVIRDVKIGKSLDEALTLMKDRVPSTFIINIIVNLIEANRMGNSISLSIKDQLDYIENKRKNKIIKYHKMMPFKVAIASIIFVFAMLFLLIFCSM
ncbi:MAG: type II secretion system F family protein [Firmicutes bacterium]|nr:type II secretion system F family protein [Bacillota bacterium]